MAVTRKIKTKLNSKTVTEVVRQYVATKAQATIFADRTDRLKGQLKSYVESHGETDDKGSLWVDFDEPIEGITRMKMERRVIKSLDVERAEALLREIGLWDECTTTITVLDEDLLLAAAFEGKVPEAAMTEMYVTRENYAFKAL